MFNGKKLDNLDERMVLMTELLVNQGEQIKELKRMLVQVKTETLGNRVAINSEKKPVKVITKEIVVERARKKPRARIRPTVGGKRVTEKEIDEFVKLFDQGLNYTEISAMTGRSAGTISNKIYIRKGYEDETTETKK